MTTGPQRLKPLNTWTAITRSAVTGSYAGREYTVIIDFLEFDKNAKVYRDTWLVAHDSTPVKHAIDEVVIITDITMLGVKEALLETPDGPVPMEPLPESWEYKRLAWGERHPDIDRAIAVASWIVLAISAVMGALFLIGQILQVLTDRVPGFEYTIEMPFTVPDWFLLILGLLAILAAFDRALRMKYSWWLDSDIGSFID